LSIDFKKRFIVGWAMRPHPTRVPLQMQIERDAKDLIRRLARAEGKTMTRYVLRLVADDARRRGDPSAGEGTTAGAPQQ